MNFSLICLKIKVILLRKTKNIFFKNIATFGLGHVISVGVSFVLLPIYSAYLGVDEYGVIASMQVLSALLLTLVPLSLERSLFRVIYNYDSDEVRREFIASVFWGMISIGVLLSGVCILGKDVLGMMFSSITFFPYYFLVIISIVPISIITIFKVYCQFKEQAFNFILATILQLLIVSSLSLLFVIHYELGAYGFLLGLSIGNIVAATPLAVLLTREVGVSLKIKYLKPALWFSIPILPTLLSSFILNLSDRIFIDNYFSQTDLGLYSLGYKVASVMKLVASSFVLAYSPIFYRMANSKSYEEAKSELYNYNDFFVILLGGVGITVLLLSRYIIQIFFPVEYMDASMFSQYFTVSILFAQMSTIFNLMIYQNNKTYVVSIIVAFAAILNVGMNFVLLPIYGAVGAVWTSIASNMVIVIASYFQARKNYYVQLPWRTIAIVLVTFLLGGLLVERFADFMALIIGFWLIAISLMCVMGYYVYNRIKASPP
jgi:O-antigen/teichoic acid export membrane protein